MEELFSCRNCVHNSGQSLNIGRGSGFCQHYISVIERPERTTCKYIHRKDFPKFIVEEGIAEHAREFVRYSSLVDLHTKEARGTIGYSEKFAWDNQTYNQVTNALAQYHKAQRSWVFIQAFSGGLDGVRSLAHASLVRRYMERCGRWESSYRLILSLVQEIDLEPKFEDDDLVFDDSADLDEARTQALWDVVFSRLSSLQEYGMHSGLETLLWITDQLNGSLVTFDWKNLKKELSEVKQTIIQQILAHAKENDGYFTNQNVRSIEVEEDDFERF